MFELMLIANLIGRPPSSDIEFERCEFLQNYLAQSGKYIDEDPNKGVRLRLDNGEIVQCGPPWDGKGHAPIPTPETKT